MDTYITGKTIKSMREQKKLTQQQLAELIFVSDKAISKWETGKGYPDITLLEPLAKALGVSVLQLLNGDNIVNKNKSCNLKNSCFYVCPVCGNVIHTIGESIVSCCGIILPKLEAETEEDGHFIKIECIENEYFVSINHEMTKDHYISFIAYITSDKFEMHKLYPEQNAETRFFKRGLGTIYIYCNKHGLIKKNI